VLKYLISLGPSIDTISLLVTSVQDLRLFQCLIFMLCREKELQRYIPPATLVGGAAIGAVLFVADVLGKSISFIDTIISTAVSSANAIFSPSQMS
jgi:hypothetical protein